jgi:hypothetical protein
MNEKKAFRCNAGSLGGLYLAVPFFSCYPMVSRTLFTASLLVGILPLAGHAQNAPRFYVGAGANLLTNVPFNLRIAPRLLGPSFTAGWQFTPALALQASVAYQWTKDNYSEAYLYIDRTGQLVPATYSSEHRVKYFTVPILLRYTFAPSAERLHFDVLGGVTLVHATLHSSYASSDSSTTIFPDKYSTADTRANLTLGPAVRYAVSPHVELTANGLVSAVLGENYYRFSDRLFLNVLVGAHYTFGQR